MTAYINNHFHFQAWLTTSTLQLCIDNITTNISFERPTIKLQHHPAISRHCHHGKYQFDNISMLAPLNYKTSSFPKLSSWQIQLHKQTALTLQGSNSESANMQTYHHDANPTTLHHLGQLNSFIRHSLHNCHQTPIQQNRHTNHANLTTLCCLGNPLPSPWFARLIYKTFPSQSPLQPHSTEPAYQPCQSNVILVS